MIEKMSNKEKILEMLRVKELTVQEIAQDLNLKENAFNVYICRLRKDNLIKKVGNINRYNIYTVIEKEQIQVDNELVDKLVLLMIKAEINSEMYGIDIKEIEIESNIKRLTKGGLIG